MSDFDIVEIIPNTNEETREINSGLVFIGRDDRDTAIYLRPDDIRKIETPDTPRQVYRVYTYQDAEAHIILQPASAIYDLIKQGVKPLC
ncbi:hypothetical protein HPC37_02945 [Pasteurellaceae bacterium 20609_3]|uniref:hypothetical protein n=1 Tax=Spirabiliibacterium mucosae TaxID=28156 RepID=UPI001AAC9C53|nr:hypothetical protein [Spirabiliibacterium mucosae]MBE2897812.1 hypothetical protein [Spirabiliibacterium mucosae]